MAVASDERRRNRARDRRGILDLPGRKRKLAGHKLDRRAAGRRRSTSERGAAGDVAARDPRAWICDCHRARGGRERANTLVGVPAGPAAGAGIKMAATATPAISTPAIAAIAQPFRRCGASSVVSPGGAGGGATPAVSSSGS